MTQIELINEINKRLVKAYKPLEIYLYGQHDWGISEDPEDIELTVVVPTSEFERQIDRLMVGYKALCKVPVGKYIFVFTKEEFDTRVHQSWTAAYNAKKYGQKIYERP